MLQGEAKRTYQRTWINARKSKARELKGGVCVECGSKDRLEFDHVDPALKPQLYKNRRSVNWSQAWVKLLKELELCQLLCYTCHKAKTIAFLKTSIHGLTMYKNWGCRCTICKAAKQVENAKRYI